METENGIDTIDYKESIIDAFPGAHYNSGLNALIVPVNNFDDMNYGFSICPNPGDLIEFKIPFGDGGYVSIEKWEVSTYSNSVKYTRMYRGPYDKNFIVHLLENYKSIG